MKRWTPQPGEIYYYVGAGGSVASTRAGRLCPGLIFRLKIG